MPAHQVAFILFVVAAILAALAAVIPEASGRLLNAAIAFAFAGFAFALGSQ